AAVRPYGLRRQEQERVSKQPGQRGTRGDRVRPAHHREMRIRPGLERAASTLPPSIEGPDQDERTSGVPAVWLRAAPGSHVGTAGHQPGHRKAQTPMGPKTAGPGPTT